MRFSLWDRNEGQKVNTGLLFGPDGAALIGGSDFEAAKAGRVVVAASATAGIAIIAAASSINHAIPWTQHGREARADHRGSRR